MTILAGEEICLKLEDVHRVINLSNSNLPCQYMGKEPLQLSHLNKQFELYDLGDLLFGQPSTLDKLHYALAI